MAATFLYYCATCDKQISVSNRTTIYCSESCRRKDEDESFRLPLSRSSASSISLPSLSHLTTTFDAQNDKPPRNIVAPASPTARTYPSPPLGPQEGGSPPSPGKAALSSSATASPPYTLSTRPLPPRQNPSAFSGSPRSIELVNPFASQYGAVIAANGAPISMPGSLNDAVRWGNPAALEGIKAALNGQTAVTNMTTTNVTTVTGSGLLGVRDRAGGIRFNHAKG